MDILSATGTLSFDPVGVYIPASSCHLQPRSLRFGREQSAPFSSPPRSALHCFPYSGYLRTPLGQSTFVEWVIQRSVLELNEMTHPYQHFLGALGQSSINISSLGICVSTAETLRPGVLLFPFETKKGMT